MTENEAKALCGVVMPISSIDGCSESHWSDVLDIVTEAVEEAGFEANLVSNADEVGIIHKRIIQNLYDNPIVVCDVSGKNPNVMFELGLRLAFDKPTVIIKDDKTAYSFDTSAIEHIEYPRDLRFSRIVEFKQKLSDKISATHEKATKDATYTTFLKHFGEFTVAKLDKKEVSGQQFILEELKTMRGALSRLEIGSSALRRPSDLHRSPRSPIDICLIGVNSARIADLQKELDSYPGVANVRVFHRSPTHRHLFADYAEGAEVLVTKQLVEALRMRARRMKFATRRKSKAKP